MWFSQESAGLDVGNPDFAQQLAQLEQGTQCLIVFQTRHRGKQTKDRIGPLNLLLRPQEGELLLVKVLRSRVGTHDLCSVAAS